METNRKWLPAIVVSEIEQERLTRLASAALNRIPEVAEELLSEMERASVVAADSVPAKVIQMGSTLEYKSDAGKHRRVTLVFPDKADISQGKISILTPVGAALIGLTEGQSIMLKTRDGREQELTVLLVEPLPVGA